MNNVLDRCPALSALLLIFSLVAAAGAAEPSAGGPSPGGLSESELQGGWIALFDGQSLYGWKPATKANWSVADGEIRVSDGEPGLLHTTTQFADYELKLEFRASAGTNSGVFLRTSPRPAGPASGCYELNIAAPDESPFPTGSLVDRKKAPSTEPDDAWHQFHVTADGGRFTVRLDGKTVLQYEDNKPIGRGFIGLQLNHGAVAFRNIRLRPLGLQSIFNGKDLSGWKVYPDKASRFSVTDKGTLLVENGPGQLETTGQYADFVLQAEVFVNGKELNSGIFFRSIPGDFSNGYESQIHNGFVEGDRARPSNGGTGGIFRRQEARLVVADDFTWLHKAIICEGPHMAVWVNGIQVSDWTDRRKPDVNPRKGLRLEKGTIILQGHDPTTNLQFRNLRIVEMAARR